MNLLKSVLSLAPEKESDTIEIEALLSETAKSSSILCWDDELEALIKQVLNVNKELSDDELELVCAAQKSFPDEHKLR